MNLMPFITTLLAAIFIMLDIPFASSVAIELGFDCEPPIMVMLFFVTSIGFPEFE